MPLKWSEQQSCGVKELDEQHKQFIALINGMLTALEKREVKQVIDDTLRQLLAFANFHFATEEKYLDMCEYPGAAQHKLGHQKLVDGINELAEGWKTSQDPYVFYYRLLNFMKDWLKNYLVDEDQKFTKCLNDHGVF